jgi:hypothetical protein
MQSLGSAFKKMYGRSNTLPKLTEADRNGGLNNETVLRYSDKPSPTGGLLLNERREWHSSLPSFSRTDVASHVAASP